MLLCIYLQKNWSVHKWELTSILYPVLEVIMEALSRGKEIHLNKFGHFFIRH